MKAVAERYKGKVHAYEIWNEQNYAIENGGTVAEASYYVDLLAEAYKNIKAVDPSIIVVSGSPTPTGDILGSTVPEPASLWLTSVGLILCRVRNRR